MEQNIPISRSEAALKKLAPLFDAARECGISPEFRQSIHSFSVSMSTRNYSITTAWKKEKEVPDLCFMLSQIKAMS